MKTYRFNALALGGLLAWNPQLAAQGLPDPRLPADEAMQGFAERHVEFEWIMRVSAEERALLSRDGAELLRYLTARTPLAASGDELLRFTVPPALDASGALLQLVPETLRDRIDRNDIYELELRQH